MVISNHIIQGIQFKQTPNIHGSKIVGPKFLIIHYSASGETAGTVAWLTNPVSSASAHIVIGRDGEVWQLASFDQKTWHCGESEWEGLKNLNSYAIGIELVSFGSVTLDKDGKFRSRYGHEVSAGEVRAATHKNEAAPRYWQQYRDAQLEKLVEVSRAILEAYPSIEEVLGHDDIAPTRKTDPGPLFPWDWFLVEIGRKDAPATLQVGISLRDSVFEIRGNEMYITLSDKEGDISKRVTLNEARALRDWLNENLPE